MRSLALAVALALALAGPARAEEPTGTVRGAVTVQKRTLFGVGASDDRSGVVVYVTGYGEPPPKAEATLEQRNERFVPRLLPVVAGQSVSANKLYGTRVLLSEATRAALGPAFLLREIDLVRVVGRKQPVRLFELVAHENAAGALARRVCALYERALGAYRARDFAAARAALEELLASAPDDGPARVLLSRVGELARNPPPPDWDGVFALETK